MYKSLDGAKELINNLIGYRGGLAKQICDSNLNIHKDTSHPLIKEYWKVIDQIEEVRENVLSMENV